MLHGVPTWQFLHDLWKEISEDNVFNGAAALGYYLTLAIHRGARDLVGSEINALLEHYSPRASARARSRKAIAAAGLSVLCPARID